MNDYTKPHDLHGRTAVVTGAGGFLGREIAICLAQNGANLALLDVNESSLGDQAHALTVDYGVRVSHHVCDVASVQSVERAFAEVRSNIGLPDLLVNNAASRGADRSKFFSDTRDYDIETWNTVLAVNLTGMLNVAARFGKDLINSSRAGTIVQIASIYSSNLGADQRIYEGLDFNTPVAYSSSKAGVVGLSLHLATEWAQHQIRVNCLTPGGVASKASDPLPVEFVERYSNRVPMGRMAEAHEIAQGVLFLSCNASSYITGHNLIIDGGLSAW